MLASLAGASASQSTVNGAPSLEALAFYYGTDKSHDDHKYVDLYETLFDPIRDKVLNMTEVGVAGGKSLELWQTYFPHAHIWGLDVTLWPEARRRAANLSRVTLLRANARSEHACEGGNAPGGGSANDPTAAPPSPRSSARVLQRDAGRLRQIGAALAPLLQGQPAWRARFRQMSVIR